MNSVVQRASAASQAVPAPPWWSMMRPAQWLKNGFVLAPLIFAKEITSWAAWRSGLVAAAAFCLAASAGYIWNDLRDLAHDRHHPSKKHRALAAGAVRPTTASMLALACLLGAGALAWSLPPRFALMLGVYWAITFLYSLGLKRLAIADVMAIAAGFVVRVLAGSAALNLPASHWILLCTFLLAAFLGCVKRKAELAILRDVEGHHRPALRGYSMALADQISGVMLAAAIISYALYAVAPDTVAHIGSDHLLYTLPLVIYGMLRYLQLSDAHLELAGEASRAVFCDRPLQVCIALWLATVCLVLYWR